MKIPRYKVALHELVGLGILGSLPAGRQAPFGASMQDKKRRADYARLKFSVESFS